MEREFDVATEDVTQRLRRAEWDMRCVDLWNGLPQDLRAVGDVVASYFMAECATDDESEFVELTRRVADAARDRAQVVLAYMRRSGPYRLQDDTLYPALPVDEQNLPDLLGAAGLTLNGCRIRRGPIDEPAPRPGYDGMTFVDGEFANRRERADPGQAASR